MRRAAAGTSVGCQRLGLAIFDLHSLDGRYRQAYIDVDMRRIAVFIPEELLQGLKALKAEHGTPEAESIRRAVFAYLVEKGVKLTQKGERRPKKRK
jgi:hypothetical protein